MTERNETAPPAPLGQVERPVPKRCEHCDGTGDVTGLDGEWRGYCSCDAGRALGDASLLQRAATAAGYTWREDVAQQRGFEHVLGLWIPELTTLWNPLADSGYALDLAVKLRITVEQGDGWSDAGGWCTVYHSDHGGDACAATRRAIVRVAAELASKKTPNVGGEA